MRALRITQAVMLTVGVSMIPTSASAQGPDAAQAPQATDAAALRRDIDALRQEFLRLQQQYGDRLTALEQKLATIQGGQPPGAVPAPAAPEAAQPTAAVPPGAAGRGGPQGALPGYGAQGAGPEGV